MRESIDDCGLTIDDSRGGIIADLRATMRAGPFSAPRYYVQMEFVFELRDHGWAGATIAAGETKIAMNATYLADSVREMAAAVRTILSNRGSARFSFMDEPGEHRFILSRNGKDVEIRVLWFEKTFSTLRDDGGRLVFETSCSAREFAQQFVGQLRTTLDKHGEDEYLRRWRHPFPTAIYKELLTLRRSIGSTPKYE